MATHWYEVKG